MRSIHIRHFIALLALSGFSFFCRAQSWPEALLITPEKTFFAKTSSHQEVMDFLEKIQELSDNVHVISMGKSREGRDIPVAVLARPAVRTAAEAKASGKLVVYVQGNIHGGEVEGKEALLILMRDILLGDKQNLLDNQIILFAPIYNTDGNDKMEKGRRPSQEDSPLEVGTRANGDGLDLNRDGIKMETLETQGLITNVIGPWDPQLFVDLHTTNGTWHAYSLTWAPSYHYAGEAITSEYTNDVMLNEVTRVVEQKYGLYLSPYGDYNLREGWPVKNFYTYNHHPRYLVNQFGLRNRMAILSEAFSHERFYQRINSTYAFVTEILTFANAHGSEIRAINNQSEQLAISNVLNHAGKARKGVRFEMKPDRVFNEFRTYDYVGYQDSVGRTRWARTGKIVLLDSVTYHARFVPVVESTLPRGYVIPAKFTSVIELLKRQGVMVAQLEKSKSFSGEVFNVSAYKKSQRSFEGHFMATVDGSFSPAARKFRKGDYVVDLAQPLANLIFYILEPQSDDGLVTWNFFDDYFAPGAGEYPIFKYY